MRRQERGGETGRRGCWRARSPWTALPRKLKSFKRMTLRECLATSGSADYAKMGHEVFGLM